MAKFVSLHLFFFHKSQEIILAIVKIKICEKLVPLDLLQISTRTISDPFIFPQESLVSRSMSFALIRENLKKNHILVFYISDSVIFYHVKHNN